VYTDKVVDLKIEDVEGADIKPEIKQEV